MASANHGNTGRRKPSVWNDFHPVIVSGPAGERAMATCNRCGTKLQACSKKHGTSHLRRHANSSCCEKRAALREAAAAPADDDDGLDVAALREAAAAPADDYDGLDVAKWVVEWVEDLRVVPEVDSAGRIIFERGDELVDAGGHAPAAGDHGRLSANFIQDALPQAPASSSTRFFQKKRKRQVLRAQ
ncbi:uncharacterized protein [Triticum aestivum]|uniref:uncharacterized protein n=1 Tax=Triticum aestivum TaxID=4565 RepID=UPI001D02BF4D|nr:uncharacterized protein LOC123075444 [Triticum aestivum]